MLIEKLVTDGLPLELNTLIRGLPQHLTWNEEKIPMNVPGTNKKENYNYQVVIYNRYKRPMIKVSRISHDMSTVDLNRLRCEALHHMMMAGLSVLDKYNTEEQ